MARDYSLAFTLFGLDTPIIDVRTGLATEAMRLWQENITTNLYGPTGAEDVTLAIPTGSYVGAVSVAPNKGLSVSGVVGPAYTATLDLAQDIRVTASPTFVTLTLTGNLVIGGLADGRDISADGNKLDTIETGATANSSDATLLARANHTGTQTASTISDFNSAADARVASGIATHEAASDPHTGYQKESEKDAANGYAGLNSATRTTKGVDTTDDIIIDLATKGLVLKDTQGTPHYWRVTISTLGMLQTADLGTVKP